MATLARSPRQRIRKVGRIVLPGRGTVVDCIIQDISATGALLLADTATIPDRFLVVFRAKAIVYDVEVVRRGPKTLGVRFLATMDARSPDARELTSVNLAALC